jgi:hypothetical protein
LALRESERRSKSNHDRPSRKLMLEADDTQLSFEEEEKKTAAAENKT